MFLGWYSPFNRGWKLCNYVPRNAGYDDEDFLSQRLLEFKSNDETAVDTFIYWSVAKLRPVFDELEINYCIRSLGRNELTASKTKPLNNLAQGISDSFGMDFKPELIAKRRPTRHLVGLDKTAREAELDGVFYLNRNIDLNGSSILLVDDIKTSGTTSKCIRKIIIEQFANVKCYLFVLAETSNIRNSQELIDIYSTHIIPRGI